MRLNFVVGWVKINSKSQKLATNTQLNLNRAIWMDGFDLLSSFSLRLHHLEDDKKLRQSGPWLLNLGKIRAERASLFRQRNIVSNFDKQVHQNLSKATRGRSISILLLSLLILYGIMWLTEPASEFYRCPAMDFVVFEANFEARFKPHSYSNFNGRQQNCLVAQYNDESCRLRPNCSLNVGAKHSGIGWLAEQKLKALK